MTDDKPLELAVIAASMVREDWLPGVKVKAMPDVIRVMAKFLRDWPTSKPETLWITAQGEAPEMKLANLRRQGVPVRVLRASDDVNDLNDMVKPRSGQ